MPESLSDLEQQRSAIFEQMRRLPDFRSGSIPATPGYVRQAQLPLPPAPSSWARSQLSPDPQGERQDGH